MRAVAGATAGAARPTGAAAGDRGPPGGATGGRPQGLLDFLQAPLLGHRQAAPAPSATVAKVLPAVVGLSSSRGQLAKVIGKVTAALDGPYQELLSALPGEPSLNVDETGHKDGGRRMWTWRFRAGLYTLFRIDPT